MDQGSNPPSGQPGGRGRRRRRGRRPPVAQGASQQPGQQPSGQPQSGGQQHSGQPRSGQPRGGQQRSGQQHSGPPRHGKKFSRGRKPGQRPGQGQRQGQLGGGIYSAPMDHSYRAQQGTNDGNSHRPTRGRPGQPFGKQFLPPDPEPLPSSFDESPARIFAFVDDLFFLAKIQETARKMNVKVEFIKTDKDVYARMEENGGDKPSLIIFDLNSVSAKPLTMIPKLKAKLKKATNIIGFVSHVQGDLKLKAQEAGCDMVVPRSAFSQNLAQILRRHGAPEDLTESGEQ